MHMPAPCVEGTRCPSSSDCGVTLAVEACTATARTNGDTVAKLSGRALPSTGGLGGAIGTISAHTFVAKTGGRRHDWLRGVWAAADPCRTQRSDRLAL